MNSSDGEIGQRVQSLLEQHNVERREMATHLGIDPSALSRAITGQRRFKAREIALIAERLQVPVGHIFEDQPEKILATAARLSANSPGSVDAALKRASLYVEASKVAESRLAPDFSWVRKPEEGCLPWQQGQALAEQVLEFAELGREPLPAALSELARALESRLGIQLALEPLGPGLDGLAVSCEHLKLALISTSIPPARQRWTMAHELGHLLVGDTQDLLVDQNVWAKSPQETRTNAFAAAFLMPEGLLRTEWGASVTPTEELVAKLLDTFHVSLDALAFRLHNVGLVNASGRDAVRSMRPILSLIRNQADPQAEGWSWLPSQLTNDVIRAYADGRLGARWLAAVLKMDADELLERLTASPEEAAAHDAADESSAVA